MMVVELRLQYCREFKIHLRHKQILYDVYFLSLIEKSTFKIIFLRGYVLRIGIFKIFKKTRKNIVTIL